MVPAPALRRPRFLGMPEQALVHELARVSGVPLYSLEPEYAHEGSAASV